MPGALHEFDVVIVGAGPTGLTIASVLGMHGVRTLLVERNPATVPEPRAVSIDDESMRTMQYLGLDEEVRSRAIYGYGSYYYSARGTCFAKVIPETMEYGHPRRSAFRQPVLEAQLRNGLRRFASVQTSFSTELSRFSQDADSVAVSLTDARGVSQVRAGFLVAADGARSSVREALGIAMSGNTYDQQWLIVDLIGSTDRFRHTRVYCDPVRPALALPGPDGTRRYEFMLLPGEAPDSLLVEERVRALLRTHSEEDARLEIVRKTVYRFHARIAERWRVGRVFLAGDAAHLSPPFAGQGMNSGVRDAHNLAWKLAAVVRGQLGPALLDTYERERKPHAAALIQMAVNMGRIMMPKSRLDAAAIQGALRLLSLYRPARDYVMQMKYKPKPHFAEGLVTGDVGATLRGRMLPQPIVELRDGTRVLLDHVLGNGFGIVEIDDGELPLASEGIARPLVTGLVRVLPREQRFIGPHEAGFRQVRDVTGTLCTLLRGAGVRGVIVRPDRYVAAAIGSASSDGEADRLFAKLADACAEGPEALGRV
jgi:3-(3-hydroxy-phenyl)propionate hydroxylase